MIVGTFKGKNSSCGFLNNKDYIVKIDYRYGKYWLFGCEWKNKEQHACPYDTIEAILKNWDLKV